MGNTTRSVLPPPLRKTGERVARHRATAARTGVGAGDEPQAAVLPRGVFQGDPEPQDPAQGLRVQEGGVLVRGHCNETCFRDL